MKANLVLVAGAALLALAGCVQDGRDANSPMGGPHCEDDDIRIGPTPTNGITTPGNPDSSADLPAGSYNQQGEQCAKRARPPSAAAAPPVTPKPAAN